ncbi:MAG: N-6 DNA methylase [Verrucomicrobiota bacterium]
MLDTETKRRIDSARDILVGKVPDPKSQVEQITIALIYKFMDDMDAESEELGGKRTFFSGDFARYGWPKLMRSGLGGHEVLALYGEAIAKMPENPGIPLLFRDIFKNAYLPYRDPETLKSFLKIIDEFEYDHSERLGDAFEYLLSVLGSQGDAGQFRTPRHIIDFMVEILDPKKDETVLDPACGTAGFLISSYKHIQRSNVDKEGTTTLTPDEKGSIAKNFRGYDISPDMVRLSLVNLYLHGFNDPHIYEYDTLTSDDKWNEYVDVILANPPFMSPKGGIKPHKRFSIQAKRSEVLFVDYMAEHLTPNGRAGIIVPEGIIFQAQNAYKQLRKMLVDDYLVAVISLPAGVFQPYSGVKTSILILDKTLAKQSDTIAFLKVESDGFGLGAQRREIEKNDLPQVKAELDEYLRALRSRRDVESLQPSLGLIVEKAKIAENGEYNLSGERYREVDASMTEWPLVEIGEVARLINGRAYKRKELLDEGPTPVLRVGNFFSNRGWYYSDLELPNDKYCDVGDLLFAWSASFGPRIWEGPRAIYHYHIWKIETTDAIDKMYLFHILQSESEKIKAEGHGIAMVHATKGGMEKRKIPLPPLSVQKEIVAEIEGYQKIIDGSRAVLDNYRPHIPIHPNWPIVELESVCKSVSDGDHQAPPKSNEGIPFVTISNITSQRKLNFDKTFFVPQKYFDCLKINRKPQKGDILYSVTGSYGIPVLINFDKKFCFQRHIALIRPSTDIDNSYLHSFLCSPAAKNQADDTATGVAQKTISLKALRKFKIPLPPLATQQSIVAEIEAEQALVAANRELIERMEKKIQVAIARVWGDERKDNYPDK